MSKRKNTAAGRQAFWAAGQEINVLCVHVQTSLRKRIATQEDGVQTGDAWLDAMGLRVVDETEEVLTVLFHKERPLYGLDYPYWIEQTRNGEYLAIANTSSRQTACRTFKDWTTR